MEDPELNKFIHLAKTAKVPACPGDFEANVFRRIRLSRAAGEISVLDWFFACLPRKGFVLGAFALAVFTSGFATFVTLSTFNSPDDKRELAGRALDFSVFRATEIIAYNNH